MISTRDIYIAYRKLKGECYFDSGALGLRYKLSEWELPLVENHFEANEEQFQDLFKEKTDLLLKLANDDNYANLEYFQELLSKIGFNYQLKSLEEIEQISEDKGKFITNALHQGKIKVKSCNYLIDAPLEVHLLAVLWIMCLNKWLDKDLLYKHNYANVVRNDTKPDVVNTTSHQGISLSVNHIYYHNYRKWRDKALTTTEEILKNNRNATIFSLDIKRFFYSSRIDLWTIIEQNISLGLLQGDCKNDPDFIRLTQIVQSINREYTDKVRPVTDKLGLGEFEDKETMLPVGLISSGMIANLYLSKFDRMVSNMDNCRYYGRYVDDMLFVFEGKQDYRTKNPVKSFIASHFLKQNILHDVGNDSYYLDGYPSLVVQREKTVLHEFCSSGSTAALKLFKKKLQEKVSESRFILDEDSEDEEFESSAYNLDVSDSVNKLRNIDAFREDKFGASRYLSRKISLACILDKDPDKKKAKKDKDDDKKAATQILRFFKGRTCLTFASMWEKVATYFIIKKDYKSLEKFFKEVNQTISKIKKIGTTDLTIELDKLQEQMKAELEFSLAMPFSIAPTRIHKSDEWDSQKIEYIAHAFRMTNMMRQHRIGLSCLNYTDVLNTDKDLYSVDANFWSVSIKRNILWWLSPRFLTSAELSSLSLYHHLSTYAGGDNLEGVPILTNDFYNRINFSWISFFEGKQIANSTLFNEAYTSTKSVLALKTIDYGEYPMVLPESCYSPNKKIGVANYKVKDTNFLMPLKKTTNLSQSRKKDIYKILDDSHLKDHKADILVLPELSIPYPWLDLLVAHCKRHDMAMVTGLEYIIANNYALNIVVTILPIKIGKYYKDCVVVPRVKNHYAPAEKRVLDCFNYKIPDLSQNRFYNLFHWRGVYFTVFNCFEMACIEDRSLMKGMVDFLIATEYNPDTSYYSDVVGSMTRDIYAYLVQVNTSQYGDSRVMQPTQSKFEKKVFIKGGEPPVVIIEDLHVSQLRDEQLMQIHAYNNTPYKKPEFDDGKPHLKPAPPGYEEEYVKKRMRGDSFSDIFTVFDRIKVFDI